MLLYKFNVYLSPNRDLCVSNMLACLTRVSFVFSVISISHNYFNFLYTSFIYYLFMDS